MSAYDEILIALAAQPAHSITSSDGMANSTLRALTGLDDAAAISRALWRLERDGLVTKDVRARRCYGIALTPAGLARTPSPSRPALTATGAPTARDLPPVVAAPATPALDLHAPADLEVVAAVAHQLLMLASTNAQGIAATEAAASALREELARATEACEEAELRALAAERELAMLRAELANWKERCARLEANLDAVMRGPDTSRAAYDRARELSRLLAARPGR